MRRKRRKADRRWRRIMWFMEVSVISRSLCIDAELISLIGSLPYASITFVMYADGWRLLRYRNMCRYNSGVRNSFHWRDGNVELSCSVLLPPWTIEVIPVLLEVSTLYSFRHAFPKQFLSRVEYALLPMFSSHHQFALSRPDVTFFCDIDYDPFLIMQDQNKLYGFTISLYEYEATIPTLWDTVKGLSVNSQFLPSVCNIIPQNS